MFNQGATTAGCAGAWGGEYA